MAEDQKRIIVDEEGQDEGHKTMPRCVLTTIAVLLLVSLAVGVTIIALIHIFTHTTIAIEVQLADEEIVNYCRDTAVGHHQQIIRMTVSDLSRSITTSLVVNERGEWACYAMPLIEGDGDFCDEMVLQSMTDRGPVRAPLNDRPAVGPTARSLCADVDIFWIHSKPKSGDSVSQTKRDVTVTYIGRDAELLMDRSARRKRAVRTRPSRSPTTDPPRLQAKFVGSYERVRVRPSPRPRSRRTTPRSRVQSRVAA